MPFLTDLSPHDRIELNINDSSVRIKVVKRTGSKVRLSIDAKKDIEIKKVKIDDKQKSKTGK